MLKHPTFSFSQFYLAEFFIYFDLFFLYIITMYIADLVMCCCLCLSELVIPDRSNVFYALNNSVELNFALRPREIQKVSSRRKGRHKKNLSNFS